MLCNSVPGHHVFNNLQPACSRDWFHSVPNPASNPVGICRSQRWIGSALEMADAALAQLTFQDERLPVAAFFQSQAFSASLSKLRSTTCLISDSDCRGSLFLASHAPNALSGLESGTQTRADGRCRRRASGSTRRRSGRKLQRICSPHPGGSRAAAGPRRLSCEDASNQQGSTLGGQSGILMNSVSPRWRSLDKLQLPRFGTE